MTYEKAALTGAVVSACSIVVMAGLCIVVPRFVHTWAELDVDLSTAQRVLVSFTHFLNRHFHLIAGGVILLSFGVPFTLAIVGQRRAER